MGQRKDRSDLPPAPGDLRVVQAFLNTVDRHLGTDELTDPYQLAEWLTDHGLLAADARLDAADLERTLAVREGLRARISGAADGDRDGALDRAMAAVRVRPGFAAGGIVRFEPAGDGLDRALAGLAATVAEAQLDGRWSRFKVCACGTVFYDASPNRIAKWCRKRCGNRISAQASRRRKRRLRKAG